MDSTELFKHEYSVLTGVKLIVDHYLPIHKTYSASDLKTGKLITIYSGEKIHCIKQGNKLIVSQGFFDKLKKEFEQ